MKTIEEWEEEKKSYITKEELINILTNMDFCYVENYDIKLITGFKIKIEDTGEEYLYPLGKNIRYY